MMIAPRSPIESGLGWESKAYIQLTRWTKEFPGGLNGDIKTYREGRGGAKEWYDPFDWRSRDREDCVSVNLGIS